LFAPRLHSPKIQRLVTPERLQRRRHLRSLKRRKTEQQKVQVAEYQQVVAKRLAEKKEVAKAAKAKKRSVFLSFLTRRSLLFSKLNSVFINNSAARKASA